jgi:DNA-binding IclR family transcriptional regulator
MAEYSNASQERILKVMLLLAGHEFEGIAPGQIADALKTNPGNVTRDLRVMQSLGLAEPLPHMPNRWRLAPKLVQIANAYSQSLS